jgi:acetone carboxylase alpha subunit
MTGLKMSEMKHEGGTAKMPSAEEVALIKKFLNDTTLFLGPDPEIMQNHDLMPRTADGRRVR